MHEGTVQLVAQACNYCGYGVVQPRVSESYDRYAKETIVEATWLCPRCNQTTASGIVERRKDEE